MIFTSIFLVVTGLIVLILGGEIFVRGSASTASKLKISPIVIGLTVVAFGTSAPEMVVNIFSAISGSPDIAIGNILGSNISNILLVLGVSAMIYPLTVKKGTTWKEIPFGILAVIVLFLLANDIMFGNNGTDILTRGDGLILISFFLIFLYYTFGLAKVEGTKKDMGTTTKYSWPISIFYIIGGITCLVIGGKLIVDNGIILAKAAGLSELFIGLTIVAIGTSLPELATAAIAAWHKHDDLAIGSIVGSNIFNVLWVLGITPVIKPIHVSADIYPHLAIAIGSAVLLFIFMFTGKSKNHHTLRRWQGFIFVLLYVGYITFIALNK